jgi:hypothetical protein
MLRRVALVHPLHTPFTGLAAALRAPHVYL